MNLIPNISKIFEILLSKALLKYSNDKDAVHDAQFGFRLRHSALHAHNKFTSDVFWALNDKQLTGACMIDLEKAFDTVWLDGLFFRLIKKGYQSHFTRMLWKPYMGKKYLYSITKINQKSLLNLKRVSWHYEDHLCNRLVPQLRALRHSGWALYLSLYVLWVAHRFPVVGNALVQRHPNLSDTPCHHSASLWLLFWR